MRLFISTHTLISTQHTSGEAVQTYKALKLYCANFVVF